MIFADTSSNLDNPEFSILVRYFENLISGSGRSYCIFRSFHCTLNLFSWMFISEIGQYSNLSVIECHQLRLHQSVHISYCIIVSQLHSVLLYMYVNNIYEPGRWHVVSFISMVWKLVVMEQFIVFHLTFIWSLSAWGKFVWSGGLETS